MARIEQNVKKITTENDLGAHVENYEMTPISN